VCVYVHDPAPCNPDPKTKVTKLNCACSLPDTTLNPKPETLNAETKHNAQRVPPESCLASRSHLN
jgi:hypothetical protein